MKRILVPIRLRTVRYERLEVPRNRDYQPFVSRWTGLEIVDERPYCPAHAARVSPTIEDGRKLLHLADHELPRGWHPE